MSFGVGYGDIVTAIRQGKQLYDSFADDFESAPQQVRELLQTSQQLRDTVEKFAALFDQWGQQLPGVDSVVSKLDEADAFVRSYSVLVPQNFAGGINRARRIFATSRHAFDGRAEKIREGLQLQLTMLLANVFLFGFQNAQNQAVHRHDHYFNNGVTPSEHRRQFDFDQLELLSRRLVSLRNERERIAGEVRRRWTGSSSAADTQRHHQLWQRNVQNLQDLWAELWRDHGYSQAVPPLPIEENNAGLLSANFRQGIVLNQDLSTIHAPVRQGPPYTLTSTPTDHDRLLAPQAPRSENSALATPTTRTAATSPNNRGSSSTIITTPLLPEHDDRAQGMEALPSTLGLPGLPLNRATFVPKGSKMRVKLDYYRFSYKPMTGAGKYAGRSRILEWRGENPNHLVRHYILASPADTFPYSKHSTFEEPPLRLTVHTPGHLTHQVELKNGDSMVLRNKYEVEYRFTSDQYYKDFCSDLRDKTFLGSFETHKIKCKNGDHINECIKLWRSRDLEGASSLSFFANGTDEGDVEYPLRWVLSPIKIDEANCQVTLDLQKRPANAEPDSALSAKNRIASMLPNKPLKLFSRSKSFSGDIIPALPSSKRGSTTTTESGNSSNATIDDLTLYCPVAIYEKVRNIVITFSTQREYVAFLETYQAALDPSNESRPTRVGVRTGDGSEAHRLSNASSVNSNMNGVPELGDPAICGSFAAVTTNTEENPRFPPHQDAQELPTQTPSSTLFGKRASYGLANFRQPDGFQRAFSDRTIPLRLDPGSASLNRQRCDSEISSSGYGHSYDVPDPSSSSAGQTAKLYAAEPPRQAGIDRFEPEISRDTGAGAERPEPVSICSEIFEMGQAQYGETFEMPTRMPTRKRKDIVVPHSGISSL